MSPIQRFREIEDGELRGDRYEGVTHIHNFPDGQFEIPSIGYKGNYISLHLKESYEAVLGNVYSLYCISSHGWNNPMDFRIDERMKGFGSHCLMVKDNEKFLARIEKKLTELNVKFYHGFVEYYKKDEVNRKINLFEKPLEFEYQKEFRFYVERDAKDEFVFRIGSLQDLAEVWQSEVIVEELKLERTS